MLLLEHLNDLDDDASAGSDETTVSSAPPVALLRTASFFNGFLRLFERDGLDLWEVAVERLSVDS